MASFYFMGICGTAMGQAAVLLRRMGHRVVGSDQRAYPPMSTYLEAEGIELFEGYSAERLGSLGVDYVVVGNAMSRGHEEVEWLLENESLPMLSLPELIKTFLLPERKRVVFAGTHGKTTTSSLCAYLLKNNAAPVGYLFGGLAKDLDPRSAPGAPGAPFVLEGDEYDSAFFDKRSKFIHYRPHLLGITCIELDHIDIFRDIDDVLRSFKHVVRLVPRKGYVVINGDDPQCQRLLPLPHTQVVQVGLGSHNDLQIKNISTRALQTPETTFELWWRERLWQACRWQLLGTHNVRNAAMAAVLAALAHCPEDFSQLRLDALSAFRGVERRAQLLASSENCLLFEDFGHHPTAIGLTLEAFAQSYPQYALWAAFDPRSNSTRTRVFEAPLKTALQKAQRVFIGPIDRPEQLSGDERLEPEALAQQLTQAGTTASAYTTHEDLYAALLQAHQKTPQKHLICLFSNGAFGGLAERMRGRV